MDAKRFEDLAEKLAALDPGLSERLERARAGAERLRARLAGATDAFARRARALGADQLTSLSVSPVGPDQKHTDCLQFSLERGRWALICVALAEGEPLRARIVGPFRRGQSEGPCADFPLESPEAEAELERRALELIQRAAGE